MKQLADIKRFPDSMVATKSPVTFQRRGLSNPGGAIIISFCASAKEVFK
jgi:hypothetical protein